MKHWPGQRVRAMTQNGVLESGTVVIKCGLRNRDGSPAGEWFVKLDTGSQEHFFEWEMEAIQ